VPDFDEAVAVVVDELVGLVGRVGPVGEDAEVAGGVVGDVE